MRGILTISESRAVDGCAVSCVKIEVRGRAGSKNTMLDVEEL